MIKRAFMIFVLALNTLSAQAEDAHKQFFSTHGVVLFYSGQCTHCRQFAPVLKHWADQYGAEVLPLSFDNQKLPELPNTLSVTTEWVNAAFQENPIQYPALFVVNPKTKSLYPVGIGSMTETELSARMEVLIPKINAYEQGRLGV